MIALRGVRFGYGRAAHALVCDALDLGPGVTLLLGPNGAGKSTLLKLAAGVEHPASGVITIDGVDLWRNEAGARAGIAYVPEHPDLTPYATLGEVLGLVCRLRGRPVAEGVEALAAVALGELAHRSVRELSMGQRRRAVLAAAFVGAPPTLLLDEPLETMDRGMRGWLTDWISSRAAAGATVVVATHDIEPFVEIARRAVVVTGGVPALIEPLPADVAHRARLLDAWARGAGLTPTVGAPSH